MLLPRATVIMRLLLKSGSSQFELIKGRAWLWRQMTDPLSWAAIWNYSMRVWDEYCALVKCVRNGICSWNTSTSLMSPIKLGVSAQSICYCHNYYIYMYNIDLFLFFSLSSACSGRLNKSFSGFQARDESCSVLSCLGVWLVILGLLWSRSGSAEHEGWLVMYEKSIGERIKWHTINSLWRLSE